MIESPFPKSGAAQLCRWLNTPRELNFCDDVASDAASIHASLAAKTATGKTFALMLGGKPIGFLGFTPASSVMGWFAGMVIAPEHRGKRYARTFLETVAGILRAQGFRKLSALFFADNEAIRRTFQSAGAVEEGYLRMATLRGGELVDAELWSFNEAAE